MIEAQKKVLDYCSRLQETIKPADLSEAITGKITPIVEEVRERQLVVPVVGAFSSGKSSMINTLLETSVLPVAITPETSLATELHFSTEEYVEAVKSDGTTVRYAVNEMSKLTTDAAQYAFACLYLNNRRLKEIEPLALVDMPGFDSPLDAHNKAILVYLGRGCHYIVLSSVEEGTVSKSLMRRMSEIEGFDRGFNFFLSKANLRPKETVDELVRHYTETIHDVFDTDTQVIPLDNKSAENVLTLLKAIDVNAVFFNMYRDGLINICNDCLDALNIKIKTSTKDAEKITDAVKQMNESIEKLKKKAAEDMDNMRRKYSHSIVDDVVKDVGRALENSIDELISVSAGGNQDALSRRLNEIVQSELVLSAKNRIGEVNQQIVIDFSESLKGLDKVMKDLDLDSNYLNGMVEKVSSLFTDLPSLNSPSPGGLGGNTVLNAMKNPSISGLSRIGGLALTLANPVVGIIVALLPDILNLLFGGEKSGNDRQNQAIRSKLTGEIFPNIKSRIRSELPSHLNEQLGAMIEQVQSQYAQRIKMQEEEINKTKESTQVNIEAAEAQRKQLESVRTKIQTITNEILTWGK